MGADSTGQHVAFSIAGSTNQRLLEYSLTTDYRYNMSIEGTTALNTVADFIFTDA